LISDSRILETSSTLLVDPSTELSSVVADNRSELGWNAGCCCDLARILEVVAFGRHHPLATAIKHENITSAVAMERLLLAMPPTILILTALCCFAESAIEISKETNLPPRFGCNLRRLKVTF
jgi:hypothetical protein